jgi:hypothetical protein
MLTDERIVGLVDERLDRASLSQSMAGTLIRRVLDLAASRRWTGSGSLLNEAQDEEATRLVSELLLRPQLADQIDGAAADCLAALERQWVERQWRDLRAKLAQPGLPVLEVVKLQQQVLDLRRKLDNIPALSMQRYRSSGS